MKAWLRCKYPVGMRLSRPGWVSGILLMLIAAGALVLLTSALRISGVWAWSRQPVQTAPALVIAQPAGAAAVPAEIRAALAQALGRKPSALGLDWSAPDNRPLLATPGQQLALTAAPEGVRLYLDDGAAVDVQLVAVNAGAREIAPGYTKPYVQSERVRILRGSGLTEWYASGAAGIEQGFSLAQALSGDAATTRLQLQLTGALRPVLAGDAVQFKDSMGHVRMTYGGLLAYDAGHRRLPAHMALQGRRLSLIVDTRNAVYPVTIDPVFAVSDLLTEPTPVAGHQFGYAVSVSASGSVALVGAPGATTAYVFTYASGGWSAIPVALPDPGKKASDEFGQALALSADGTHALIGAPGVGKAYLFSTSSGAWQTTSPQVFTDPQGNAADDFGGSVALSADGATVLIGAKNATAYTPAASTKNSAASAGRAYAYSSASWSNPAVFQQPTPAVNNWFGFSVALASGTGGDTALIGAPDSEVLVPSGTSAPPTAVAQAGQAYVYQFSYSASSKKWNLAPPAASLAEPVPTSGDQFGYAVSLSSDGTAGLVGAPFAAVTANGGTASGAGKVYQYTGGTWSTPLEFDDPGATGAGVQGSAANDNFGLAVALSPDNKGALIGAPGSGITAPPIGTAPPVVIADAGEVYIYSVARGSWPPQAASLARPQVFPAPDEAANNQFGSSVAASALSGTPVPLVNGLAGGPLLSVKPPSAQTLVDAGSVLAMYTAADLSLTVSATAGPVAPGSSIVYDFTVTNNDTSITATNLVLTDALPAGTGYSSSNGAGGNCTNSSGTVTCTLASLGPNKAVWQPSITVTAPNARTVVSNTAAVSADQQDQNQSNNTVTVTTGVAELPVANTGTLTAYVSGSGLLSGRVQSGQTASFLLSTPAAHGTVTVNASGSYTYTASPAYLGTLSAVCGGSAGSVGTDSFQFEVSDGAYTSSPATVTVTVYPGPTACPPAAAIAAHGTLPQTGQLTGLAVLGSGQTLTYGVAAQPSHGTVQVSAGGAFTYTPGGNYTGPDAFTFSVSDQYGNSSTAVISITDYAALTVNNGAFTLHGSTSNVPLVLTGNEPDPAQIPAITVTTAPKHGTVTLGAESENAGTFTMNFTYAPASSTYTGADSFSFTAKDAYNTSNTGTVTFTVYTPPVADNAVLVAHVNASGTVTAEESDPTQQLVYAVTASPAHGKLTTFNTATGAFTYQADAGYSGADSFQFTAKDSYATSNVAAVSITDFAAPVASDGGLIVHSAGSGTLQAADPDSQQALVYSLASQPAHGVVTLNAATGAYIYRGVSGYTGPDSFTFNAHDSYNDSNTATISVTDYAAPSASNGTLVAHVNASGTLAASDPDSGQALVYAVVKPPLHGTVNLDAATGAYSYTASAGYSGSDSFTFSAHDSYTTSNTAVVSIAVFAAPTAGNTTLAVHGSASGQLVATDPDSKQALSYAIVTNPAHGKVSLDATTGSYSYTADAGFSGSDSFTYDVKDSYNTSNLATVSLVAYGPPTASGLAFTAAGNGSTGGQLPASDPDLSQSLTYFVVSPPAHGSLQLDATTGGFMYTPTTGFSGTDSFSYAAKDAYATSNTAEATVTVTAASSAGGSTGGGANAKGPPAPVSPSGGGALDWLGLLLLVGMVGLRWQRK